MSRKPRSVRRAVNAGLQVAAFVAASVQLGVAQIQPVQESLGDLGLDLPRPNAGTHSANARSDLGRRGYRSGGATTWRRSTSCAFCCARATARAASRCTLAARSDWVLIPLQRSPQTLETTAVSSSHHSLKKECQWRTLLTEAGNRPVCHLHSVLSAGSKEQCGIQAWSTLRIGP